MPCPAVRRWCFEPFLRRSVGFGPVFPPRSALFHHDPAQIEMAPAAELREEHDVEAPPDGALPRDEPSPAGGAGPTSSREAALPGQPAPTNRIRARLPGRPRAGGRAAAQFGKKRPDLAPTAHHRSDDWMQTRPSVPSRPADAAPGSESNLRPWLIVVKLSPGLLHGGYGCTCEETKFRIGSHCEYWNSHDWSCSTGRRNNNRVDELGHC